MRSFWMYVFTICLLLHAVAGAAQEDGWLYRVRQENGPVSYLIGVLPSSDPASFQWSDSVYYALEKARVVAVDELIDSAAQAQLKALAEMEGERNFSDWMTNAQFARIDALLMKYDKGSLWPWVQYYPLYMAEMLEQWRLSQSQSAKAFLLALAGWQNKKIFSLYAPEALAGLYSSIPLHLQTDMLVALSKIRASSGYDGQLIKHYHTGKAAVLYRYLLRNRPYEWYALYTKGKIHWIIQTILPQLRRTSTAMVVDASLLGGKEGLVARLREQGWRVTPMGSGLQLINTNDLVPVEEADTVTFVQDPEVVYYPLNEQYRQQYFQSVIPSWYKVVSFRGAFAVRMPDRPEEITETLPVEGGQVTMRLYKFEDRALNQFYLVSFYDYPQWYTPSEQPGFFRQVISRTVNRFGGLLLLEKDISTRQYEGREIEIQVDGSYTIRVRFYLVGHRMYQVALGATGQKAYSKQNEAFLRSFRILDQKMTHWFPLHLGFGSVAMPGHPQRKMGTISVDSMPAYYFSYSRQDTFTLLSYNTTIAYLPPAITVKNPEQILRKMIAKVAASSDAILIEDRAVERGTFEGRYVALGAEGDHVIRLMFLYHEHRLLQLMVAGPEDSAFSAFADHYFDSLEVSEDLY